MPFKDYFSEQAAAYAAYRPAYPAALYAWLAALAPASRLAWDCATGSGQAAAGLASYFDRVVATDASRAQLAHAAPHPQVEYRVAPAEESGLAPASVDLVTVAQALHWFDIHRFYAEVRRVARPEAVVAVWAYGDAALEVPELDRMLRRYTEEIVGPYWPPERQLVEERYRTIPFPFTEVTPPPFTLEHAWTLEELAGYLRTWSATTRYIAARKRDPVLDLAAALAPHWGGAGARHVVRWPLGIRVGRVRRDAAE